jgi:hypothetical protein
MNTTMTQEAIEIEELKTEIFVLKKKLKVCQEWMDREVKQSIHKIASKRVGKMTIEDKTDFLTQNQEEIITNHIR